MLETWNLVYTFKESIQTFFDFFWVRLELWTPSPTISVLGLVLIVIFLGCPRIWQTCCRITQQWNCSLTQKRIKLLSLILSLTGALKIHNLFFTNTGSVSAKDLPTDLTVRPSNIKVMRPPPRSWQELTLDAINIKVLVCYAYLYWNICLTKI